MVHFFDKLFADGGFRSRKFILALIGMFLALIGIFIAKKTNAEGLYSTFCGTITGLYVAFLGGNSASKYIATKMVNKVDLSEKPPKST